MSLYLGSISLLFLPQTLFLFLLRCALHTDSFLLRGWHCLVRLCFLERECGASHRLRFHLCCRAYPLLCLRKDECFFVMASCLRGKKLRIDCGREKWVGSGRRRRVGRNRSLPVPSPLNQTNPMGYSEIDDNPVPLLGGRGSSRKSLEYLAGRRWTDFGTKSGF